MVVAGGVVAAALVLLPMAVPSVSAEDGDEKVAAARDDGKVAGETSNADKDGATTAQPAKKRPRTNWPVIVASSPKVGATDVDPKIDEISVTFDRDMDVGGYSWTGSGPNFPPSPEGSTAVWKDKRTCVMPVELKKGMFYRVGINATSFQNFKSELGVPAETTAIYFVTEGANRGVANRVRVPKVVKSTPEIGATDVDPRLSLLSVTFDVAMDPGGFSWTGGGPSFPAIPEGQKPRWSRDGKTCTLPVKLEPGKNYELGLNSVSDKNFASKWGVPLEPVRFEFTTAGDASDGRQADAGTSDVGGQPRIVDMVPANGAKDVDPSLRSIVVQFDRPMAAGFSWTGGGEHFPTIPDGKKPKWSADRKTCTLPVTLKPNWDYRLGLNSVSFQNFASADGVPLEPVVYEFRTSDGEK